MIPSHRISQNETLGEYFTKVKAVWPTATFHPFSESHDSCYIQVAEGVTIWQSWKEWRFDLNLPEHLRGMRERFREAMCAAIDSPNRMNVPTKRAIENWIKYRKHCIDWLEAKYEEVMPQFEADKKIVLELVNMAADIDKKSGHANSEKFSFEDTKEKHFSFDTPLGSLRVTVTIDHRKKEIYFTKKLYMSLYNEKLVDTIKSFQNG